MWTKRLPSGDGSGSNPTPRPNSIVWMPCSRSPDVSTIRSRPSAVSRTTWDQPSASDTNRIDPSGSQLASESKLVSPATGSLGAGCDVDQHDLRGFEVVEAALGRDGNLRRRRETRPGT